MMAGVAFPAVVGAGLVSNDAGDTVTTVSTDVVDGPLPLTTTGPGPPNMATVTRTRAAELFGPVGVQAKLPVLGAALANVV